MTEPMETANDCRESESTHIGLPNMQTLLDFKQEAAGQNMFTNLKEFDGQTSSWEYFKQRFAYVRSQNPAWDTVAAAGNLFLKLSQAALEKMGNVPDHLL